MTWHRRSLTAALLAAALAIPSTRIWAQPAPPDLPVLDEADPIHGRQAWMIRNARIEGAAGNVRETASKLRSTAERMEESGRLLGMAELLGDGEELNRRVQSARLAAEVLDQRL